MEYLYKKFLRYFVCHRCEAQQRFLIDLLYIFTYRLMYIIVDSD